MPLAFGAQSPNQATGTAELTAVANGSYDSYYQQLATYAENAGYTNITWRLGWEFDGSWMPWSSTNSPTEFVAAYQHVHDLIKAIMPNATFDWCGNLGYTANWTAAYPGDAYVDTIGMDVYDFSNYQTQAAFNTSVVPSLNYQESFALAHHKQVSYPEWGLGSHDDPQFIQSMYDWMASLPQSGDGSLAYNDYFNANTGGATDLNTNPNSKAKYISLFSY